MDDIINMPHAFEKIMARIDVPHQNHDILSALDNVHIKQVILQDFKPLCDSLEWEISDAYWKERGAQPFAEDEVPFIVNNSGILSENTATVLFANCTEFSPDGDITVVELGAGSALFSKYFLDAFRAICHQEHKDFYTRLVYVVSDRSPSSVARWQLFELFKDHGEHVLLGTIDALHPKQLTLSNGEQKTLTGVRAVLCNYVLDVLPIAVVKNGEGGCEQLHIRTHLLDDEGFVRQYAHWTPEQIRNKIRSGDAHEQAELANLINVFDLETAFLPCSEKAPPYADEALSYANGQDPVLLNFGAVKCLQGCLDMLEGTGFILINDYGPTRRNHSGDFGVTQRFGSTVASGLNFPLLGYIFKKRNWFFFKPEENEKQAIFARLLANKNLPDTCEAFFNRFGMTSSNYFMEPLSEARKHAAARRLDDALKNYKTALARSPKDWAVIGEIAEFVGLHIKDFAAGIELARAAVELNPWYSAWVWNVLGDCLFSLERFEHAH